MTRSFAWVLVASPLLAGLPAQAQEQPPAGAIAPVPFGQAGTPAPGSIYTTKDSAASPGALPWQTPDASMPAIGAPVIAAPGQQATPQFPAGYMPFKKGSSTPTPGSPTALPMNQSVPVESIDGVEVSEPAAPVDMQDVANPASEDPSAPTELTSPLFAANSDTKTPRKIVLRVLNKVTASAEVLKAKPGEVIEFGKLQIDAIQCYQSAPNSQPDSVALLSISEHVPDKKEPKLLFHGWMYASSPSITALEHPVYDVTMVDCAIKQQAPVDAIETESDKKTKKPGNKKP